MSRQQVGQGTHGRGKGTGVPFADPRQKFYTVQDDKLIAHSERKEGVAYMCRHDVIAKFGRSELYRVRKYKR